MAASDFGNGYCHLVLMPFTNVIVFAKVELLMVYLRNVGEVAGRLANHVSFFWYKIRAVQPLLKAAIVLDVNRDRQFLSWLFVLQVCYRNVW